MTIMACSPCCVYVCTIYTSNFSTDDKATNWSVSSGTWTISGGTLNLAAGSGLIVNTVAGTTGHGTVTVDAKAGFAGTTVNLIGAYVDANNYLKLEVVINGASSTVKLFKIVAGVSTQLGSTTTFTGNTTTFYHLSIGWTGSVAAGSVSNAGTPATASGAYTGTGNQFALSGSGSTVTFDNLTFSKGHVDNVTCPDLLGTFSGGCNACTNSVGPAELQLDVGGITGLSGSYVLSAAGLSGSCCIWNLSVTACNNNSVLFQVLVCNPDPNTGTGYLVEITIACYTGSVYSTVFQWQQHFTSLPDCLGFSGSSFTLITSNNNIAVCLHQPMCTTPGGPTAAITAL